MDFIAEGRRKREEGRRKREEGRKLMVFAINNLNHCRGLCKAGASHICQKMQWERLAQTESHRERDAPSTNLRK